MDLESQLPTNQFDKEMAEWAEKPLPERIARILLCCVLSVIVVFVAFWAVAALEERDGQDENYIPNCLHPYPEENRNDDQHENYIPNCLHPYPEENRNVENIVESGDQQAKYGTIVWEDESEETNIDFNAPKDLGIATGDDIDERKFKQDASDLESDVTATRSIFEDPKTEDDLSEDW
eukprot:761798_1